MKIIGSVMITIAIILLLLLPFNTPTNFHGEVDGLSLLLWAFCGIVTITMGFIGFVFIRIKK